jgi:cytochrome c oxidase subunit IV
MADHQDEHAAAQHAPAEHGHPGAKEYLGIAVILTVITAVEVAVFYIPSLKTMLVPILLVLSAVKFALVVMFYMHLKFDARLFSWLFITPLLLMAILVIMLLRLFGHW